MNNFDEIISLGAYCNTSLYLQSINKKKETHVFDWAGVINTSTFKKLLETKFEKFFEHDDFIPFRDGLSFGMFNKANNICYIHDKFDKKHFSETRIKYIRRAGRFVQLMNSGKKILFIRIQAKQNEQLEKACEYNDMVEFSKYLTDNTNIKFAILLIQYELFLSENICDIDNKIVRIKYTNTEMNLPLLMSNNKTFIDSSLDKINI